MGEIEKQTKICRINNPNHDRDLIVEAANILRSGGLVVFPTETVYGIGANALDEKAVAKIFAAKGRPQDNPLIAHIATMDQLLLLTTQLPESAKQLAELFWPGPLTLVLPRSDKVPDAVSAGLPSVAVRMPSHPVAQAILRECAVPVAAPSANRSGCPSPTTAEHCIADLSGRVDLIVDGGACPVGLESTVLSLLEDRPRLLRPGAVTLEQLETVLGEIVVDRGVEYHLSDDEAVVSPGMKYKHYAPRAQVILVEGNQAQFRAFMEQYRHEQGVFALAFEEELDELPVPALGYGAADDPGQQAQALFAALRELDRRGAARVYAHSPSREGMGLAVYNRLIRAAGFSEIIL